MLRKLQMLGNNVFFVSIFHYSVNIFSRLSTYDLSMLPLVAQSVKRYFCFRVAASSNKANSLGRQKAPET